MNKTQPENAPWIAQNRSVAAVIEPGKVHLVATFHGPYAKENAELCAFLPELLANEENALDGVQARYLLARAVMFLKNPNAYDMKSISAYLIDVGGFLNNQKLETKPLQSIENKAIFLGD